MRIICEISTSKAFLQQESKIVMQIVFHALLFQFNYGLQFKHNSLQKNEKSFLKNFDFKVFCTAATTARTILNKSKEPVHALDLMMKKVFQIILSTDQMQKILFAQMW